MSTTGVRGQLGTGLPSTRRVFRYSGGQWIRERPQTKRLITWIGVLLQGLALACFWSRSLPWLTNPVLVFAAGLVLYLAGIVLMNAMLTSELVRRTQLEAGQNAARQVQHTLIPAHLDPLPGYKVGTY